jgi:RNA polymerase subunit RPABC4/transcription elongation factor Spt4
MLVGWPGGSWENTVWLIGILLGAYGAILWLSAIVWAYRDVRDRTRDSVSQSVAVLLVLFFNVAGLLLYLILRPRENLAEAYERSLESEALLQELEDQQACPTCRRQVEREFIVCPHCRTRLRDPCHACGKALSFAWTACPYCGTHRSREAAAPAVGPVAEKPEAPAAEAQAALPTLEAEGAAVADPGPAPSPANPEQDESTDGQQANPPRLTRRRTASAQSRRQRAPAGSPEAEPLP